MGFYKQVLHPCTEHCTSEVKVIALMCIVLVDLDNALWLQALDDILWQKDIVTKTLNWHALFALKKPDSLPICSICYQSAKHIGVLSPGHRLCFQCQQVNTHSKWRDTSLFRWCVSPLLHTMQKSTSHQVSDLYKYTTDNTCSRHSRLARWTLLAEIQPSASRFSETGARYNDTYTEIFYTHKCQ